MKVELYNRMVMNRRTWLKGTAAVSAAGVAGSLGAMTTTGECPRQFAGANPANSGRRQGIAHGCGLAKSW